ncbi:MAG: glycoside hydrolase family 97 catalytic domain-containing protein [Bacteroidaceae bacterium]|nr:glycoside hydrolase family 97 catalytic domain-containing protein [Bacteroidaceae bacterium]
MTLRRFLSVLLAVSSLSLQAHPVTELTSPDGNYRITLDGMGYSVRYKGRTIVGDSRLGVEIDNRLFESALAVPRGIHEDWCSDLELKSEERTTVDTVWTPLYGENARIRDHYNQLILHYEKGSNGQGTVAEGYDKRKYYAMDIIVRAYDEGIAFRYFFPETANSLFLHVTGEQTTFAMPEGTTAWYEEWAQGPYIKRDLAPYNPPVGDEAPYNPPVGDHKAGSKQAPPTGGLRGAAWFESERPLLLAIPPRGEGEGITYVALLEAAMKDYARGKFRLAADHVLQVALYGAADLISPYATPWRVIMAADRAVDLINHKDLILNLAPAPQSERAATSTIEAPSGAVGGATSSEAIGGSYSWVRPGKAFRSGKLEKAAIFKSIDFCEQFGIDYVELDAGWYGPEGKVASDARKVMATRDFTMPEVCQYARSKGVGVWVYVNQRALYQQLDELLPLYREWGISGIKFGFVHIGSQQWSTWLHEAVAKCARYGIMVDIHDEYRPTGLSRTFPNLLTQEGIRGNEEMPDATHNVTLPFTRYLCGPGDYTLCYFNNRVKNTKGHQLAMAAVYYSPLQFLFWYDNPFPKGWDAEELQFWRDCPTVFDESIALDGRPGEFIIQARRSGDEWFIGAMTNTEARTVTIPTDFLPEGKYEVTIYNDDPTLNTLTKVGVTHQTVNRKTSNRKSSKAITLQLQANGGAALHIVPKNHYQAEVCRPRTEHPNQTIRE